MTSCTAEEMVPAEHTLSRVSSLCSFLRRSGFPRHAGLPRPRRSQRRERCPGDPGVPGCAGAAGEQRTWGSAHVQLCPPPPATRSELAFQGESQHWALGTVSRERVVTVAGTVCIQGRLVVGLWDRQCIERMQGQLPGTEGQLYRGRHTAGEYDSPCTGGDGKCWKVCPGLTQQFFHDPRAVEAIGPQALQVPWVPQG